MKKREKRAILAILFTIFLGNLIIGITALVPYRFNLPRTQHEIYCDVDQLEDGNYVVTGFPVAGLPVFYSINQDVSANRIYIINKAGEIQWEHNNLYFPHEVQYITSGLSNNPAFLIANAAIGGVDQILYPNKTLEWQWRPELINWTKVVPEWGPDSYANTPSDEYGHYIVNDVEFVNGTNYNKTYDSLLISIKHLNTIILVNYTAEMEECKNGDKIGNASNIYWNYGFENSTHYLYQQHNPDMLPNGNIIISDSENQRLIILNQTTKQIVWECKEAGGLEFSSAKDIDYLPATNTFLVTDTGNNRVLEMDWNGTMLWEYYSNNVMLPYEADLLKNGNILISGGGLGTILEITREKDPELIWMFDIHANNQNGEYHVNLYQYVMQFNLLGIMVLSFRGIYVINKRNKFLLKNLKTTDSNNQKTEDSEPEEDKKLKKQKSNNKKIIILLIASVIGCILGIIFARELYIYAGARLMRIATANSPEMPSLFPK
jgi:hypothetical protein